jgi:hypothetical protein
MTAVRLSVLAAVLALAAPATASATSPWQPFRAADFDLDAGTRCDFALSGRVLEDGERIRTFDDGTQEVKGPLVVRYINRKTEASVVRDLTGTALIETFPDRSSRFTLKHGSLAVGLGASDPGGPAFLVLSGRGFTVDFGADGSRTVTNGRGTVENICTTLG